MIDNNFFLSKHSVLESTDGGAYLNNFFAGNISRNDDERYTPYHLNHSTEVKGLIVITNGDHRFYNNIFVGGQQADIKYGLSVYEQAKWPIYAEDNVFCNGAKPMVGKEQGVVADDQTLNIKIEEVDDNVYLSISTDENLFTSLKTKPVDASRLGITKLSGYPYEHFDGMPFVLDKDYFGLVRSKQSPIVGPMELSLSGNKRIKVW